MRKNQTEYHIVKQISKTDSTKEYLATKDNTKLSYSLKQIDLCKITQKEFNEVSKEYRIQSMMNSKFIVKLYDTFQNKNIYNVITEYVDGGTLSDYISKEKKKGIKFIKEDIVWHFFIELTLALHHIHSKKVVHRNIKPTSIKLTQDLHIKISNFDIADEVSKSTPFLLGFYGTPYYLAPEIFENKPYNGKVDTWSLGVVLYELCTFNKPFTDSTAEGLRNKIIKEDYKPISNAYSKEMKNMIDTLLTKNDTRRPSIRDIIKTYVFVSKAKTANLYDYVLKLCPWITKMKGGVFPGMDTHRRKKNNDNYNSIKKEDNNINRKRIENLILNSRLKCTQFFEEIKQVTLDTNFINKESANKDINMNDIMLSSEETTSNLKYVSKSNFDTTKTFVPVIEDKKDNELEFPIKDVNDFTISSQDNEVADYNKELLDDLNEKIIFLSKDIIKDIGELKFIDIIAKLNEKSLDIDSITDISPEVQSKFKNYIYYQTEIENIENDLKRMI